MDSVILNLILWTPFMVAILITGLIFMIGGYINGFRKALVSFCATIVGAVISVILAKIIAPIVTPEVIKRIPIESLFSGEIPVELITMFAESIIQVVVTQILFLLLLIFLTTICRMMLAYFFGQEKETWGIEEEILVPVKKPSNKWGGLGVGFANATLCSLLLVLPFYGTIAAYIPTITKMYSLSVMDSGSVPNLGDTDFNDGLVQPQDELLVVLEEISNHPAVVISGNGPVADVYDLLSETKVNNVAVNYSKMADTMADVMEKVQAMKEVGNEADLEQHGKELLKILRKDVIEEEWAYELMIEVKSSLKDYIPQMDNESYAIISKVLDSVCSSKENFKEVGIKILDSVIKTMESGVSDTEKENDLMKIFADILEDAGIH